MRYAKYNALIVVLSGLLRLTSFAQGKNDLIINLGYFNDNNRVQYLKVITKSKIAGKFQPVPGINLNLYLAADTPAGLLGKVTTDEKGEAVMFIGISAQAQWRSSPKQTFIAVSEPTKLYDGTKANTDITKARIKIDTMSEKKIIAVLSELKDSQWVPVKGADMKVAVKRMDGDLNVNETPIFTTDSTGAVNADFKRDGLPGDAAGNLILVAKVEDNDSYGNLSKEMSVPWGSVNKYVSGFDQRTLFARRGHSPFWLEILAYAIIAGVWIVLLFLSGQIVKLKRLGVKNSKAG